VQHRLVTLAESWLEALPGPVHANQPQVAHRELRQAVLDFAEVQERQEGYVVEARLREQPPTGFGPGNGVDELGRVAVRVRKGDEVRLPDRPRQTGEARRQQLEQGRTFQVFEQVVEVPRCRRRDESARVEFVEQRNGIAQLRVLEAGGAEYPALAIDETNVETLRITSERCKLVDETTMRRRQDVNVVLADEVEHLDEVSVVIERRQVAEAPFTARRGLVELVVRPCFIHAVYVGLRHRWPQRDGRHRA